MNLYYTFLYVASNPVSYARIRLLSALTVYSNFYSIIFSITLHSTTQRQEDL